MVLALLKEMRIKRGPTTAKSGRGLQQPLPAPDTISYNIALSALARAGETSLALSLFDEMVSEIDVDVGNDSRRSSSNSGDGGVGDAGRNEEVDRGGFSYCLHRIVRKNKTKKTRPLVFL